MLLRHASAPNRWRPQSDVLQKTSSFLFCLASLTFGGAVYIGADDHSSVIDVVLAVLLETLFRAGHTHVQVFHARVSVGGWFLRVGNSVLLELFGVGQVIPFYVELA